MRTFLRVGHASLPSIYQTALSGELRHCLVDPDALNDARSPKHDHLDFALVLAPPPHLMPADLVTPEVYMHVVEQARRACDLVVIDTQIVESRDKTGMVDRFVAPLMRAGAWSVGITDLSSASMTNLITRLKAFATAGASPERMMTLFNKIPTTAVFDREGAEKAYGENSHFLGFAFVDDSIIEAMNRGRSVHDNPALAPLLDAALNRATGRSSFAVTSRSSEPAPTEPKRPGGLLARFRKKAS